MTAGGLARRLLRAMGLKPVRGVGVGLGLGAGCGFGVGWGFGGSPVGMLGMGAGGGCGVGFGLGWGFGAGSGAPYISTRPQFSRERQRPWDEVVGAAKRVVQTVLPSQGGRKQQ